MSATRPAAAAGACWPRTARCAGASSFTWATIPASQVLCQLERGGKRRTGVGAEHLEQELGQLAPVQDVRAEGVLHPPGSTHQPGTRTRKPCCRPARMRRPPSPGPPGQSPRSAVAALARLDGRQASVRSPSEGLTQQSARAGSAAGEPASASAAMALTRGATVAGGRPCARAICLGEQLFRRSARTRSISSSLATDPSLPLSPSCTARRTRRCDEPAPA
jgi:hypothetical protein